MISFVITSYNNDDLLTRCINSFGDLFEYNEKEKINLEFIVVDDGSKILQDKFIPEKYKSKIFFFRQNNEGLSGARNSGINLAKNKYIQFIDGDDYIVAEKYIDLIKKISNEDSDILRIGFYNLKNKTQFSYKNKHYKKYLSYFTKTQIFLKHCWSSWTHIYKKEFLIKNKIHFTPRILAEDLDLYLSLFFKNPSVATYDICVYKYDNVSNLNSITNSKQEKLYDDVLFILRKFYLKNNILDLFLLRIYNYELLKEKIISKKTFIFKLLFSPLWLLFEKVNLINYILLVLSSYKILFIKIFKFFYDKINK